jgi:L-alanine-DL-glutamate epimerase-like enolase superfamily enzyme
MKIVKAETILLAIPFESGGLAPWGWGGSPANTFDVLLVRLETEDGVVGWGEAFSRMEDRALKQMIDDRVLPLVLGRDAKEISRIKHVLEFNLHNFGRIGPIMYGKTSGRPLVDLLGGAHTDRVEVYASLVRYGGEDAAAAAVRRAIGEGYRWIKLHEIAVPVIAAAVEAAGDDARVMLDTNCPWSVEEALEHDAALAGLGLHWLEEPAHYCDANGLTFSPHCALFGPGQIATLHLTAARRRPPLFERLYLDFETELFGDAAVVVDGHLTVPRRPGLGVDPDPAIVARHQK